MIARGLFLLTVLSNCVLSLPVTTSHLENEDVKVMKCIVEVLADVLSRPHVTPVSQECLDTLKTDDRLVKILRHHKFLTELQEIAVQGHQERAELQRDARTSAAPTSAQPLTTADADRSMLEALGGPGERSILSPEKRTGNGDGAKDWEESRAGGEEAKRGKEGSREGSRESGASADERNKIQGEEGRREEKESEKKPENSEEGTKRDDESAEKRDARRNSGEKKSEEEEEEEKGKRLAFYAHKREGQPRWAKRAKYQSLRKKATGTAARQEAPHHSKELDGEAKRDIQRSPEERELQMIAHRESRRVLEEEGSASRKSEEPEIESLAAIESELENVAQKLHELRRG